MAAQCLGFEANPGLARARVDVVAYWLPRWAQAHVARGGYGAPTRAKKALEGNSVRLFRGQPAQNRDGLAGMNQRHLDRKENTKRFLVFGLANS